MDYIIYNTPNSNLHCHIYRLLEPYKEMIDNMNEESIINLSKYINKNIYKPYTRIGTIYAQELLHEITQSSLSGKVLGISKYLPIVDIIDLKSSQSKCYIEEDKHIIYNEISCIKFIDIMTGINKLHNKILISLNKQAMSIYDISKCDIVKYLNHKQEYIHNGDPSIILFNEHNCNESILNLHEELNALELTCIRGICDVKVKIDPMGNYYCDSKFYKQLKEQGYKVFCNDIVTIYEIDGIDCCRNLIYESLLSNKSISKGCAHMISTYMTMFGEPIPFNKKLTYDKLGPMFDMYFDRPIKTLIRWLEESTIDKSNNPYTCVMLGNRMF